jgi:uncharacterized protein
MRQLTLLLALALFVCPLVAQTGDPVRIEIDSKVLGEKRVALVRVPASYATGAARYPVVYMTDGDRQIGHTSATVDFLAREGRMPEVIVVGVSNTDRTRDLTPTHVAEPNFDGRTFPAPTSGGGDKFLSFFETELIPLIESRYRTQPYRVFAGHSFGGLFALHSLFAKPKLFNAWIAVSPTFVWDQRYITRKAAEFVKNTPELNTTVVFTLGNEPGLKEEFDALQKLFAAKAPKGFEFEAVYFGDEDHGSVVMPSHYAGLRKIFAGWRFAFTPNDDPKTLLARATEHYAKLSKRAGFNVPIPENLVNQFGYILLGRNEFAPAIEVFRRNVELYPQSANVYDSLGEALEKSGQLDAARQSYERAYAIGQQLKDPNTNVYKTNAERVKK